MSLCACETVRLSRAVKHSLKRYPPLSSFATTGG